MASNETSKYKLSVVEGTELQLSLNTGTQGPQGVAGPAGLNEITTTTETDLTGFIYGDGTNVGGAVKGVHTPVTASDEYGTIVIRNPQNASISAAYFSFFDGYNSSLFVGGISEFRSWTLPDASGTLSLEGHEHDASDITSGTFDNARINFAAPSAIGSGTPNTGAFTTLSATGTATLPHIHGSLAGDLYIHVKNTSGVPLTRGTPVYIVGNVGDTDRVQIAAADNTDPAKMPAVGLLDQDLANNADGDAVVLGELPAANTNAYTLNQELFVGVGALTGTKPTTGEVQSVGVVSRVQSNSGVIVVNMQGRRKTDITAPTADTIALRNANGGISAKHIRLHGDTYYAEINPANVQVGNISFSLPASSGTIATNNTAVMLTGVQTVAGAKTFSGQMELTGQSAINSTSALTRGLGDSRYFPSFCDFLVLPVTVDSVTLVTAATLTLDSGIYYFEAYASTYTPTETPANATIRLSSSDNANVGFYGSDDYGNTPLSHIDVEASSLPSAFIRQSSGAANTFSRRLTGILKVALDETSLFLEFRQSTTSVNTVTCRSGAFMIARRISDYFIYT